MKKIVAVFCIFLAPLRMFGAEEPSATSYTYIVSEEELAANSNTTPAPAASYGGNGTGLAPAYYVPANAPSGPAAYGGEGGCCCNYPTPGCYPSAPICGSTCGVSYISIALGVIFVVCVGAVILANGDTPH